MYIYLYVCTHTFVCGYIYMFSHVAASTTLNKQIPNKNKSTPVLPIFQFFHSHSNRDTVLTCTSDTTSPLPQRLPRLLGTWTGWINGKVCRR